MKQHQQEEEETQNIVIFLNCFIPLDGKLQLCHLTVKDGIFENINVLFNNNKTNDDLEAGYDGNRDESRIDPPSFGTLSKTTQQQNDDSNTYHVTTFECAGNILCPGFIDIQINGAFGVDFSNPHLTPQQVLSVATQLPQYGVTHFCPTLVSSFADTYKILIHDILTPLCQLDQSQPPTNRSTVLGVHAEGPFFAPSKRGAHRMDCIKDQIQQHSIVTTYGLEDIKDVDYFYEECGIKIVTLAPELPGVEQYETIQTLKKHGIVVSMGHTNATLQEGIQAVQNGACLITHLFNAMRPFHHREPGLLGLLSMYPPSSQEQDKVNKRDRPPHELFYSIIADGLHSHPTTIQMAYNLSQNVILVTDGIAAMGLHDGEHSLGEEDVIVLNGKATIRGTDTLAGSVASMDSCIRSFQKFTNCSVYEAIKAATENPANVLGLGKELGMIKVGRRADFVILDQELKVRRTIIAGNVVYENN
mmetsp:Transcript_8397/g.15847  ORF Transcript_8397/g.15847 Transcript_8397/m.15847 type:complete len:474 (+) Transcript_8397:2624-4045(+)|eukprot:CAMPEP_0176505474 /NCGR_PEP_ID=MMETSP0200_2-20121128/16517_1 /TAXON_ID=947934 /ORGANISM="Chaetoceros sp., Strain GSL56" /LENGTH=473 /DNA_ID=CAMNT_0017905037 /DNA_START=2540 /DNA_END=3961 /DNA_ORIENTATION=+